MGGLGRPYELAVVGAAAQGLGSLCSAVAIGCLGVRLLVAFSE
jgi:hypothetical protein